MWKQLRIPVGVSDFRKIRENGYYYMDKSGLIEELLKTDATVDGSTFENAMGLLKFTLSQICIEHQYLEESSRVNPAYKQIFTRLKEQTGTFTDVQSSLLVLMRMMKEYYKKPVILLLDEYDVRNGYYEKMLEVIKTMVSRKESELERGCEKVLVQIQDRQYRKKIEASGFKTVLSYGVAFYQKSCRIESEKKNI